MPTNLKRIIPLMFLTHDRLSSTCLHWHKMHLSRVNSVTVVRCVGLHLRAIGDAADPVQDPVLHLLRAVADAGEDDFRLLLTAPRMRRFI